MGDSDIVAAHLVQQEMVGAFRSQRDVIEASWRAADFLARLPSVLRPSDDQLSLLPCWQVSAAATLRDRATFGLGGDLFSSLRRGQSSVTEFDCLVQAAETADDFKASSLFGVGGNDPIRSSSSVSLFGWAPFLRPGLTIEGRRGWRLSRMASWPPRLRGAKRP
ncbi:MAG: hypothetical protein ACKV22_28830, partial [Bryobacteraceae bacterium]